MTTTPTTPWRRPATVHDRSAPGRSLARPRPSIDAGPRTVSMKVLIAGGPASSVTTYRGRCSDKATRSSAWTISPRVRCNVADLVDDDRYQFIEADVATTPEIGVDVIAHLASPASPVDYDRMPMHTIGPTRSGCIASSTWPARSARGSVHVDLGDLRRPARPSPAGDVLGQCRSRRPALLLRRSEAIREALLFARRETGVQANVVRLFNTYGPGMRHDDGRVIPEMISAALAGRPSSSTATGRRRGASATCRTSWPR